MDGTEVLRAVADDAPTVAVLVLVLILWLTGRLTRPADCDERVAAVERERDAALATLASVRVDRDTWREACKLNAESRQIADLVNRQLIESGRLTVDLVEVLRDLATRG